MRGGGVGGLLEKDSQRETIFHSLSVAGGSRQQMTGGERERERGWRSRVFSIIQRWLPRKRRQEKERMRGAMRVPA